MKSVLQVLSILIGYAGSLGKDKRRILFYACLSNVIAILMFITTGRIDSIATAIIIGIRCVLFLFKDKYKNKLNLMDLCYSTYSMWSSNLYRFV